MKINELISENALNSRDDLYFQYINNKPFPSIYIDNFLNQDVANYLSTNFPSMEQMPVVFNEPMSYKGQLSDIDGKWPKFSSIFKVLQSKDFTSYISSITGIPDLIPDSILAGGGLHQSPKSGFLDIHVDSNFHPLDKSLHRRVNIIIYINEVWDAAWGGALELYDNNDLKPGELVASITPIFNRAAIFSTTRTSWHGVSPINCPPDQSRKSLALYYYTKDRPLSEQYSDSSVIWMNKTNPFKKVFYPLLNFIIKVLKPYAKHIRRNVFDAANNNNKQ